MINMVSAGVFSTFCRRQLPPAPTDCTPSIPKVQQSNSKRIVGYYPGYNNNLTDNIEEILRSVSHLNYIVYDSNNTNASNDPLSLYIQEPASFPNLKRFIGYKNKPKAKMFLAIRLPNLPSDRNIFVNNVDKFVKKYEFEGVDIEYPNSYSCDSLTISDNEFIELLKALNTTINKELSITVGASNHNNINYTLIDFISFVNVMVTRYNTNAAISTPADNNNPLPLQYFEPFQYLQISNVMSNYNSQSKIPNDRLVLGIEFGGIVRSFTPQFQPAQVTGYGDNYYDPCSQQFQPNSNIKPWSWKNMKTQKAGPLSKSICNANNNGWIRGFDQNTSITYRFLSKLDKNPPSTNYIVYEDPQSIYYKLKLITIDKQYGGVAISDLSKDTDELEMLKNITSALSYSPNPESSGPTNTNTNPNTTTSPETSASSGNPTALNNIYNGNSNSGAIIGSVIGSILFVGILAFAVFAVYRKRGGKPFSMSKFSGDLPTPLVPPLSTFVVALHDFEGKEENDLSFKKGDLIEVIEKGDGPNDWWVGKIHGVVGEFPGNYIKETKDV